MFAPAHHAATRFVVPVRRELAVRTVFNLLGPTNPAGATRQLIGVSDPAFQETVAGALALLGVEHALVVSSEDGLDEISTSAATTVIEVIDGELRRFTLVPADVGIELAPRDYDGGTPEQNAVVTRAILAGEVGPRAELALINAGAAVYVGAGADSIGEGVEAARTALAEGAAARALEGYVAASRRHAPAEATMSVSTILDEILARTRSDVEQRMQKLPRGGADARGQLLSTPSWLAFAGAAAPGIAVIAEFKRRSPSAGPLRENPDVREMVMAYERGGASALSILTDGPHFGGSLEDLRTAREASTLPVLRKDFIVHPYQVHEARAAGADAVLLIVAALPAPRLSGLCTRRSRAGAGRAGGGARLPRSSKRRLPSQADLIGINNRDLRDFSVDVQRTLAAACGYSGGHGGRLGVGDLPPPSSSRDLREEGVQGVLVGESRCAPPIQSRRCASCVGLALRSRPPALRNRPPGNDPSCFSDRPPKPV